MSTTQQVTCEILGNEVQGDVVETRTQANAGRGIHDELVVDVGSGRFIVDEADVR